jgi:hypothetical protein
MLRFRTYRVIIPAVLVLSVLFGSCNGDSGSTDPGDLGTAGDGLREAGTGDLEPDQPPKPDRPPPPPPKIGQYFPSDGLAHRTTTVTIIGENFSKGMTAYIDGGQGIVTNVSFTSSVSVSFEVPINPYGTNQASKVTIQLSGAGGGSNLVDFQYTLVAAATADQHGELDTLVASAYAGFPSKPILGRVYVKNLTESKTGAPAGLSVQLGYGKEGIDPTDQSGFRWSDASFSQDDGQYDVFSATLVPALTQTYDVAFRFSLDGGKSWSYADGDALDLKYVVKDAGKLTANNPPSYFYCLTDDHCKKFKYRQRCKVDAADETKNSCVECESKSDCTSPAALGPNCQQNLCTCGADDDCKSNENGSVCVPQGSYCGCGDDTHCTAPRVCTPDPVNQVQVCQ